MLYLDSALQTNADHPAYFKPVTYPLPTVSCFIPSLLSGSAFRISLHSWTTPVASRATQAMAEQGNTVWFEGRILLDGVCSAYAIPNSKAGGDSQWLILYNRTLLFEQTPSWPQVIRKHLFQGYCSSAYILTKVYYKSPHNTSTPPFV